LQVALVEGLVGKVEPLLDEGGSRLAPARADTAIFYSITNTLYGLRGITFGNFLIKQVVDDLAHDLPNLKRFATLSPLPGLRAWLKDEPVTSWLEEAQRRQLLAAVPTAADAAAALADPAWLHHPELVRLLEEPLTRAAARYLVARQDAGSPIDPVGRFHLGNGARIERLNWLGDRSPRRLAQSAGLMVNYVYDRPEIEQNHEAFASDHLITVAPAIYDMLKTSGDHATAGVRVSRRASRLGRMILRP
ncbi:MAG: malonyl-CoA decarboxylase domain-containing protein, partial [Geminicoccales bacterium]